ncbi:MAG: transcriptional regulator of arginine metabolism [Acidobacteriota bacterium]|jgi:transcriptional regulator of arginine metabolism|nr:transcriptional regulator of arginine metabolism [Acidobacteriota bacterium]
MPIHREFQDRRRKMIVEILADKPMKRQVEIVRSLRKLGFKVTPSSVSRDLRDLGIVRKEGFYRLPASMGDESSINRMEDFIRDTSTAGPYTIVINTESGTAKAVAAGIKGAAWPETRGILAEDDTIFLATENVYDTRLLLQRLKRLAKT